MNGCSNTVLWRRLADAARIGMKARLSRSPYAADPDQFREQRGEEGAFQNGVVVAGHQHRPRGLHNGANAGIPEDRSD